MFVLEITYILPSVLGLVAEWDNPLVARSLSGKCNQVVSVEALVNPRFDLCHIPPVHNRMDCFCSIYYRVV